MVEETKIKCKNNTHKIATSYFCFYSIDLYNKTPIGWNARKIVTEVMFQHRSVVKKILCTHEFI